MNKTVNKYLSAFVILAFMSVASCTAQTPAVAKRVVPWINSSFDHDRNAFTQGFEYRGGRIYESTGLYDQSSLRVLDTNGAVLKKSPVPGVFAEGCTILGKSLYQLTWREMQCIVYSFPELQYKKVFTYAGEGWGLTNDKKQFLMSNGSDTVYCRDSMFRVTGKIPVTLNGKPLKAINELEFARGLLYANVWFDNNIYEIQLTDGRVRRVIDCSDIVNQERPESEQNVLNGIAYVAERDEFLITGKNWKKVFRVRIPLK